MMGIKNEINKKQVEMLSLDQLVPESHLVRKLEKAIDLRACSESFVVVFAR